MVKRKGGLNYKKGRAKEYRIVNQLKKEGCEIAFRSAGSHSEIDVIGFNKEEGTIRCIQAKPKKFSKNKAKELLKKNGWLNKKFKVSFEVI